MQTREVLIPSIPTEVNLADLQANNKLFSDDEIKQIKSAGMLPGPHRIIKVGREDVRLRYPVIAQDGKFFAIYSGRHLIGKGGFGIVKLAQDLETGEWLALKVRKVNHTTAESDDIVNKVAHELEMLLLMKAIVVTGAQFTPVAFTRESKQHLQKHYMLMNMARGDELFNILNAVSQKNLKLCSGQVLKIIIAAIQEVQALHQNMILHRDIKLENFRVSLPDLSVKLIDYGLSIHCDKKLVYKAKEACGTFGYVPEDVEDKPVFDERSEIFALGCVIGLFTNLAYIDDSNRIKLHPMINIPVFREKNPDHESILIKNMYYFLQKMMHAKPAQRPTGAKTLAFFTEMLRQMPQERKTVKVGLLDVGEYMALRKSDPDGAIICKALADVAQVWLVDKHENTDTLSNARVKCELQKLGIQVADKIHAGVDAERLAEMLPQKYQAGDAGLYYKFQRVAVPKPVATPPRVSLGRYVGLFAAPGETVQPPVLKDGRPQALKMVK